MGINTLLHQKVRKCSKNDRTCPRDVRTGLKKLPLGKYGIKVTVMDYNPMNKIGIYELILI